RARPGARDDRAPEVVVRGILVDPVMQLRAHDTDIEVVITFHRHHDDVVVPLFIVDLQLILLPLDLDLRSLGECSSVIDRGYISYARRQSHARTVQAGASSRSDERCR